MSFDSDDLFRRCLISPKTRAYEVSHWFKLMIQKLNRQHRRLKWFDFKQELLFQHNVSQLDSTIIEFQKKKTEFLSRKSWIILANRLLSKQRQEYIEKYSKKHEKSTIHNKMENKWICFAIRLLLKRQKSINLEYKKKFDKIRNSGRQIWFYFVHAYKLTRVNSDLRAARDWLKKQRGEDKQISNLTSADVTLVSFEDENIPNKKFGFSMNSTFDMMKSMKTQTFNQLQALSSIQTQTFGHQDTRSYRNWNMLVRSYVLTANYDKYAQIRDEMLQKREAKRIRRNISFVRMATSLLHNDLIVKLANQKESFDTARNNWNHTIQSIIIIHRQQLLYQAKQEYEQYVETQRRNWKRLSSQTLIESNIDHVYEMYQEFKRKMLEKAITFGTNYLAESMENLEVVVSYSIKNQFPDSIRVNSNRLSENIDCTSYALSRNMLYSSIKHVFPILTKKSSHLAETYSRCQQIISNVKKCGITQRTRKPTKISYTKPIEIHIGFEDKKESPLDQISISSSASDQFEEFY